MGSLIFMLPDLLPALKGEGSCSYRNPGAQNRPPLKEAPEPA